MKNIVVSSAKIYYDTRTNSKNLFRLTKDIKRELPDLFNKDAILDYHIEFYPTYKTFFYRIIELIEKKQEMPLLMFISKK